MSDSMIPPERAWNSWDSEHPAEMSYPPLGLSVRPCAYAASVNGFTDFPAGAGLRLGPRAIDGDGIALDLAHAGTELTLAYDQPVPDSLRGRRRTRRNGEGGLESATRGAGPPLLATFHESLSELKDEFETKGYFYLESRRETGRVAA